MAYATPRMSRRSRTVSPGFEAASDFDDGVFAHAIDDQIGFAVQQDGPPDFVAPVVIVSQAAQRRFDAAGDHRHAFVRFASPLAVRQRRPIGTQSNPTARRIRIVVADLPVGRVVIDHRVHVAGADGEEQPRLGRSVARHRSFANRAG